jgi:hypothetical protein
MAEISKSIKFGAAKAQEDAKEDGSAAASCGQFVSRTSHLSA